jgi:8-oxo-dGTP diphosphatase
MTMTPKRQPCRAACVALLRADGAVLLQLRDDVPTISFPGHWSLPGGSIEPGESPAAAALREFAEETGYRIAPEALRPLLVQRFVEEGGRPHEHHCFVAPYDGAQTIRCFEGQEMRWVPYDAALRLPLVAGQAAMIAAARAELAGG